jgi:arsenate reductase (glutaredoxin)
MPEIIIYHNGECSKSKGALEMLIEQNIPHTVRWYLEDPLDETELRILLAKLNIPAAELVRKSEDIYKENYLDKQLTENEWLTILKKNPILIERPIVEKSDRAVIARPAEKMFDIL